MAAKARRSGAKAKGPGIEVPAGWKVDKGGKSMSLALEMEDFLDAVNLINAVAPIAEEVEHHPDFHLERWNRLRITTYSHDVGKLTERDENLAKRINEVLARRR